MRQRYGQQRMVKAEVSDAPQPEPKKDGIWIKTVSYPHICKTPEMEAVRYLRHVGLVVSDGLEGLFIGSQWKCIDCGQIWEIVKSDKAKFGKLLKKVATK